MYQNISEEYFLAGPKNQAKIPSRLRDRVHEDGQLYTLPLRMKDKGRLDIA